MHPRYKELLKKLQALQAESDTLLAIDPSARTPEQAARLTAIIGKENGDTACEMAQVNAALAEYDRQQDLIRAGRGGAANDGGPGATQSLEDYNRARSSGMRDLRADKPWANAGEFFAAVAFAARDNPNFRIDPRLAPEAAASGMGEGTGADGGFNVNTEIRNDLMQAAQGESIIYPHVRKIAIGDGFNAVKLPYFDDSDHSGAVVMGGLRAYRAAEAATVTAVKPAQEALEITLQKLMALVYTTDELMQDWTALQSYLMPAIGAGFGFTLDAEFLRGAGGGQMQGVLSSATNPALISVSAESGQAAATIVGKNAMNMRARMPVNMRKSAIWLVSPAAEVQLMQMSLVVGVGGIAIWMPANGLRDEPFDLLFGRPVIPTEHCSALGTLGDFNYIDFASYLVAEKGGIVAAESMHVRFIYDEMTFRFTWRINGKPRFRKVFTPANSNPTMSPYITLAAR